MRFVIADDSGIARGILRGAVVIDCGYEVVGEARNGEDAIALCRDLHPDVVILDVTMPRHRGSSCVYATGDLARRETNGHAK